MTHCPPSSRMRSTTTESRHSIFPRSLTCSAEFICYSRGKTLHMIKRPLAISMIGCYLVCKGILLLFLTSFSLKDPATMEAMAKSVFPLPVALFFLFAGLAMTLVSGISILKGMNWVVFCIQHGLRSAPSSAFLPFQQGRRLFPEFSFFWLLFSSCSAKRPIIFSKRVSANLMLPNTPLEPTAEKRGGSEAESLCVRPILRRSCEWS